MSGTKRVIVMRDMMLNYFPERERVKEDKSKETKDVPRRLRKKNKFDGEYRFKGADGEMRDVRDLPTDEELSEWLRSGKFKLTY